MKRHFIVVFVALTAIAVQGSIPIQAQASWVIEPGVGWGPLVLGMSESLASSHLGPPIRSSFSPTVTPPDAIKVVDYQTFSLTFLKNQSTGVYDLWSIVIRNRSARTREGVGPGSGINAVVRAYGDFWRANITGGAILQCMDTAIYGDPKGGSYSTLTLSIDYRNRGISFSFTPLLQGVSAALNVEHVTLSKVQACLDRQ